MENIVIKSVEMHTGGEPLRIITSGYPKILGKTILEKRMFVKNNLDHLRKFLMFEPRGHFDMYGVLPVDSDMENVDAAFLFMHNEGYSTMCGHAVIALGRYCVDNGLVQYNEPEAEVNIECPCGVVKAFVKCGDGATDAVRFFSVPSFLFQQDLHLTLPALGSFTADISYGGAFYVFVNIQSIGMKFGSTSIHQIMSAAATIKQAANKQVKLYHPDNEDLAFIYGVIFTDTSETDVKNLIKSLCIFADSQVDRSPCGSGTTAQMALLHAKGLVKAGQEKIFENPLTCSRFTARVAKETSCGNFRAVTVEVAGNAYYTGSATFTAEAKDFQNRGFLVR